MRRWAPTAIVIALLGATAVAFATTERQKLEKTPLGVVHVDQAFSPKRASATIQLRLRHPHLLTVEILDAKGRPVANLVRERRFEPGIVVFHWRATGSPDGLYTPRATIDNGREFPLRPIRVDSVAPTATLVSYRPHVLRRSAIRVGIVYRVSEKAHLIVYVNGRRVAVGGAKGLSFKVDWHARRHGVRLRPGRYRLQLAAVDLAGNIGPRTPVFVVRIR